MPTRKRKVRKLRGSRTHGFGQVGQHRGHGSKGGRGMAGSHKHKYTWVLKHKPNYFGKRGFIPRRRRVQNPINLRTLSSIAQKAEENGEPVYVEERLLINLQEHGFNKVLGTGKVNRPLLVVVEDWSKKSEERITQAGGKLVKPSEFRLEAK